MSPHELPEGWVWTTLGEVLTIRNGRAFKPTDWTDAGLPIVRIQNLNRSDAPYNYFDGPVDDAHLLSGGELLFAWSGTPGTSFGAHIWHGGRAVLNQHIFRLSFDAQRCSKRYLMYAMNSRVSELIGRAQGGVGLRHVTMGTFKSTRIPLPPLSEQERIAAKLDAVFARAAACRARLARVRELLQQLRRSVLTAAVTGELTREWRAERGVGMEGWREVRLGEVLREPLKNGLSPRTVQHDTGVRSLSLSATTSGTFNPDAWKFVDAAVPSDSDLWLERGDILIQRSNTLEYVGTAAIFDVPDERFIYPDTMIRCRPNASVHVSYLWMALSAPSSRSYLRAHATGTAGNMPKINQAVLGELPFDLPSAAEQAAIIQTVGEQLRRIEEIGRRTITATAMMQDLVAQSLNHAIRGYV